MEKKKFDLNSLIGFTLIFGILLWIMYQNAPDEKQVAAEKAKKEQAVKQKEIEKVSQKAANIATDTTVTDAVKLAKLQGALGKFAYSGTLASAGENFTILENELLRLKIANKGGYIAEATLKKFDRFERGSGELVSIVKNNNANFNIQLKTNDNRVLNSKDLYFEPTLAKSGDDQILTMRLKAGPNEFLEYKYVLKPSNYMLDFDVRTQGLSKVLDASKPLDLQWDMKTYRNEKSISYENRYAEIIYEFEDGKDDYISQGENQEDTAEKVSYIAFKQHFFTSVLLTDQPFETAAFKSHNLVDDETKDTVFTKQFRANIPLAFRGGEIDYKMNWYYGPADYKILSSYDRNLDEIIPLGWGIFGWINKGIFVPLFGWLSSFIMYGLAIIIFTILIKIAMSPITYKSFLSQAKMKVLRPEITEINAKVKDPMKRQQETMKLYNKAGVNPMAGCIPALIQLPFMYASFQFFPSAIELRQKAFLWADDLSSFDPIFTWKTHIPIISSIYGNHVSLFPILAAVAIFFYMKMTTGDQVVSQPPQEGMPDMGKIMKIMIYLSPLMMLIFFNNYGSGLSLYNFVSNLVTIAIMVIIKKYVVDEKKILVQIEENKLKPKKQSKFQQRMQEMMEQAEAQKKANKK